MDSFKNKKNIIFLVEIKHFYYICSANTTKP